jgi:hypothetical protein
MGNDEDIRILTLKKTWIGDDSISLKEVVKVRVITLKR